MSAHCCLRLPSHLSNGPAARAGTRSGRARRADDRPRPSPRPLGAEAGPSRRPFAGAREREAGGQGTQKGEVSPAPLPPPEPSAGCPPGASTRRSTSVRPKISCQMGASGRRGARGTAGNLARPLFFCSPSRSLVLFAHARPWLGERRTAKQRVGSLQVRTFRARSGLRRTSGGAWGGWAVKSRASGASRLDRAAGRPAARPLPDPRRGPVVAAAAQADAHADGTSAVMSPRACAPHSTQTFKTMGRDPLVLHATTGC